MSDRELTAFHESGHVVMALLLGGRVSRVQLDPPQAEVHLSFGEDTTDVDLMSRLLSAVAGTAAECVFTKRRQVAVGDDYSRFSELFQTVYPSSDPAPLFNAALVTAVDLLRQETPWHTVELVARQLIDAGALSDQEILELAEQTGLLRRQARPT